LTFLGDEDLVKYGFIPEFISRVPTIATLAPLTPTDLRRILTEVRGCLISQYSALFSYSGVEIRFTSGALDEICHKAAQRGGGARGLRGIMARFSVDSIRIENQRCNRAGKFATGADV
jgi:ATP-dependent Clp protease ATP-binding subunit ClpX